MILFIEVSFYERAKRSFTIQSFEIDQVLLSFHWQPGTYLSDGQAVTFRQFSSERAFASEYLYFDMFGKYPAQLCYIPRVIIMQMNPASALAVFSIGRRKFGSCLEVQLTGFCSVVPLDIKVYDNVVFRYFDIMHTTGVDISEFCGHIIPWFSWGVFL